MSKQQNKIRTVYVRAGELANFDEVLKILVAAYGKSFFKKFPLALPTLKQNVAGLIEGRNVSIPMSDEALERLVKILRVFAKKNGIIPLNARRQMLFDTLGLGAEMFIVEQFPHPYYANGVMTRVAIHCEDDENDVNGSARDLLDNIEYDLSSVIYRLHLSVVIQGHDFFAKLVKQHGDRVVTAVDGGQLISVFSKSGFDITDDDLDTVCETFANTEDKVVAEYAQGMCEDEISHEYFHGGQY